MVQDTDFRELFFHLEVIGPPCPRMRGPDFDDSGVRTIVQDLKPCVQSFELRVSGLLRIEIDNGFIRFRTDPCIDGKLTHFPMKTENQLNQIFPLHVAS